MNLDEFINALLEGDSGDSEIEGLTAALNECYERLPAHEQANFQEALPEILIEARKTTY